MKRTEFNWRVEPCDVLQLVLEWTEKGVGLVFLPESLCDTIES